MRRHELAQMLVLGTIASIVGTAIVLAMDWFPDQGAAEAGPIDTLYDVLLICSVPVFMLVMTVAIYSVWKFRAQPGDKSDGEPIHGNTRLEIIWVTIPFIMVTALAVYAYVVLLDIEERDNPMTVNVTGQQFTWSFEYPQEGGTPVKSTRLVLPEDRQVEFKIKALDVIHSFWVPAFRLKSDAVPGLTTRILVTPDRTGTYDIVCAELCGIGHATMRQQANVVPAARFTRWLDEQKAAGGGDTARQGKDDPQSGARQLFTATGCNACHTLTDAGSKSAVGPNLDELAKFVTERGTDLDPTDYVRQSIVDPDAFIVDGFPKGVMPRDYESKLSAGEIDALVEYLLAVSEGSAGKSR